ncbi:alpha-ribazole phosphatase [Novimethylophilus kurashikiensis]|uniref:Alpha-ribazole phosphatase n=1 Tax=Novimethylophilus kurashikiensis TaxID=1825523 RepID=A0A2R5F8F9_9PROT|nr:DUF2274 domain-containing protein [Novimethylophilus kurashikiensis]GBG14506.1 alpha-ribazole phosphatase [Novimethylophilus kurashikiensis]
MKLSRIPVSESTVKHTFSLKESTSDLLHKYQACYMAEHEVEITMKDMVEAMLTSFMADDKTFQKYLKQPQAAAAPSAPAAPASNYGSGAESSTL